MNTLTAHSALGNFLSGCESPLSLHLRERLEKSTTDDLIPLYKETLELVEQGLWAAEVDNKQLENYQQIFRELEALFASRDDDKRHHFILFIPVADRPRQLIDCLDSVLQLCQLYNYGGIKHGRYKKISLLIADDSKDENNIMRNKKIAEQFDSKGLETIYFGQQEQWQQMENLSANNREKLAGILGVADATNFFHKGSPRMRNITSLKLLELAQAYEKVLFYSFDSDQEFKIKISAGQIDRDCYGLNYFYHLDELFAQTQACIVTGKVVGDPPVSPAVMVVNFLDDVTAFLQQMKSNSAQQSCGFHALAKQKPDDAAYHDMPDLFGFKHAWGAYQYPCPLHGKHDNEKCFRYFAEKANGFFYGEHPTRKSYYDYESVTESIAPARTVYPGNYIFNIEGLNYFIPFAPLKLRMNGPAMGRIVKAELKGRFVSVNLPMLHKRTVADTGTSEFRPDIVQQSELVDLSGELERQYFGDVMLFSLEKLTEQGYPSISMSRAEIAAIVSTTEENICRQYQRRHQTLKKKKQQLKILLSDTSCWWNQKAVYAQAVSQLHNFINNIEHNFGDASFGYSLINCATEKHSRMQQIVEGIFHYPNEKKAWETFVFSTLSQARKN